MYPKTAVKAHCVCSCYELGADEHEPKGSLIFVLAVSIHNATGEVGEIHSAMQQLTMLKSDDNSVLSHSKTTHLCCSVHTLSGRAVSRGRAVPQDPPLRLALDDSQQVGILLGGPVG